MRHIFENKMCFDLLYNFVSNIRRSICTVGTAVAQWLRRCAANRKVAGSIPAGVSGIFH